MMKVLNPLSLIVSKMVCNADDLSVSGKSTMSFSEFIRFIKVLESDFVSVFKYIELVSCSLKTSLNKASHAKDESVKQSSKQNLLSSSENACGHKDWLDLVSFEHDIQSMQIIVSPSGNEVGN
jgi:hypothetical protein